MPKIPTSFRLPLIIIFFEIIGFIFLVRLDASKSAEPIINFYKRIPIIAEFIDHKRQKIDAIIAQFEDKLSGDYSIYIKNLKTGETYEYNREKIFPSASLYKLVIFYKVFEDIEQTKLDKAEILTAKKSELDQKLSYSNNDISNEGQSQADDEEISYTVDFASKLMIRVSDNYAALLLAEKVGWENAEKSLADAGIFGFDLTGDDAPSVDAISVARLLEKIYSRQAVSASASQEMLDILLEQRINDRISKLLPASVKVAHKTGDLDGIRHDAGIVFGKKYDYIFVFMTDSQDPLGANDNISQASKEIFDVLED